jgi:hypothetical protein
MSTSVLYGWAGGVPSTGLLKRPLNLIHIGSYDALVAEDRKSALSAVHRPLHHYAGCRWSNGGKLRSVIDGTREQTPAASCSSGRNVHNRMDGAPMWPSTSRAPRVVGSYETGLPFTGEC